MIGKFPYFDNLSHYANMSVQYTALLYNLKNRPIFIGLEPPRDQSIDCHIHWLARACRCILVTKIRFTGFPLWKRRDKGTVNKEADK